MIGKTNVNGTSDASGVGAVLSIDAPIGSTVTVSQGSFSKVLRKPIEISTYFSRYFYLVTPSRFGSWTVTATDGTNTISETVSVTENKEYDVVLRYRIYLIQNGVAIITPTLAQFLTPTTTSGKYFLEVDGNTSAIATFAVDVTNKQSIVLSVGTGSRSWAQSQVPAIGISDSVPSISSSDGVVNSYILYKKLKGDSSSLLAIPEGDYTLDFSATGTKYVWVSCASTSNGHGYLYIPDFYIM